MPNGEQRIPKIGYRVSKMRIEVHPAARGDLPVVQNLGRFYVYDFSEYTGWTCPDDGLFGCRGFAAYWDDDNRSAFVIRVDGELAGFALINGSGIYEGVDHDVDEFFVLRKFRRKGVGQFVAHCLFDRFPGRWQVRQLLQNTPAIAFWRRVVQRYTAGQFEECTQFFADDGLEMNVQRFQSSSPA